jgi:hypothetical protein
MSMFRDLQLLKAENSLAIPADTENGAFQWRFSMANFGICGPRPRSSDSVLLDARVVTGKSYHFWTV